MVRTTIRHNPVSPNQHRLASSAKLLALVPPHKNLFKVVAGKGLPIGNLRTQFFAIVSCSGPGSSRGFHLPNRTYPRKRVIKAAAHVVNLSALGPDDDLNDLLPRINSNLGHFGHADSYRLRQQLCKTISQYDVGRTCIVRGDFSSLKNTSTTKT